MKQLSSKLEALLELLSDGRLHGLRELQEITQLCEEPNRWIVEFLVEYGFAEISDGTQRVRISKAARELLINTAL